MKKIFLRTLLFFITGCVTGISAINLDYAYNERVYPDYDELWHPNFVADEIQKSVASIFLAKVLSLFWESSDNPLNTIIDVATDKPVVFGQDLEQYRFHMWGFKRKGAAHFRAVCDTNDQRLLITFNPVKLPDNLSMQDLKPNYICFPCVEETVCSAQNSKNIVTDAAVFVANKVEKHERETGYKASAAFKNRSVAVPTKHGIYYCSKSCLYEDDRFPNKEISCMSQETFDNLSKIL